MKHWIEDEIYEGVQPEDDLLEDESNPQAGLWLKSLILLLVFLLPTILVVIEVLTGKISGRLSETIQPTLPALPTLVHF